MTLAERVVTLHRSLEAAAVPHAFGGAIALAYLTLDPRGTSDIDLNVFVPASSPDGALRALPKGVEIPDRTAETISDNGQVRLWWEGTPIDLFFDYVPVHEDAARHKRTVPFADTEIPVLGPIELVVFKALFDRTRDWADIEAAIAAGTVDLDAVREVLATMISRNDHRFTRLEEAIQRAEAN